MTTSPVVTITDELLGELREAASKATSALWIAGVDEDSDLYLVGPEDYPNLVCNPVVKLHSCHNAAHIAAANPATILALIAHVDELRTDAARYQWLRRNWFTMRADYAHDVHFSLKQTRYSHLPDSSIDDAIDAAIAKEQP